MQSDPELVIDLAKSELKRLYQEMADLTGPDCASHCKIPRNCCEPFSCKVTELFAKEYWGIDLPKTNHPRLLFMGEHGCTVEPHLRPFCTLHHCDINRIGAKSPPTKANKKWTRKYFKLREEINFWHNKLEHFMHKKASHKITEIPPPPEPPKPTLAELMAANLKKVKGER